MLARTLLLVFLTQAFNSVTCNKAISSLTVNVLQQHLHGSTRKFLCVVFINEGNSTTDLESSLEFLYVKKRFQGLLLGSFLVSEVKEARKLTVIPEDAKFPFLRCFLASTLFEDYGGSSEPTAIYNWMKRLRRQYLRWMENSDDTIKKSMVANPVTLVAITSLGQASAIKTVCQEALQKLKNHCKMSAVFLHPFSEHKSTVQRYLNISASSAIIVLIQLDKYSQLESATFTGHSMLTKQITSYVLSKLPAVKHLTVKNFESEAMTVHDAERFLPYFVGFYAWWAKNCDGFLSSFRSAVEDFTENSVLSKFALVNVAAEKTVISRYIKTVKPLPFVALFQREKGTYSVNLTVLDTKHPTALFLNDELKSLGLVLFDAWHRLWDYNPYGILDATLFSDVNEGPAGKICTKWTHNQTDSEYPPPPEMTRHTVKKQRRIEDHMRKVDGIPVVTEYFWAAAVEKSEKKLNLYVSSSETILTVLVCIRANCGSCKKNMHVFKQIHKEFLKFENKRLFLVNCSEEEQLCKKLSIKGYPSIIAIRSFGVLAMPKCGLPSNEEPYVSREYHGALDMSSLMSWLDKLSAPSVEHLNFKLPMNFDKMEDNARLIATTVPKYSTYIPVAPGHDRNYFYSLSCFRLACEMLYGLASCHTIFSKDIPPSEFEGKEDTNLIINKIEFERRDGISMKLMSLRKSLRNLMEEETTSNLHLFHRPHKYPISATQTCEEDHNECTKTIVAFTRDHLRLPVTMLSSEIFHTKNNPLFSEDKPVLIALGLQENVTESSTFMQLLYRVASKLYKEIVVTAMDVESFPSWAGSFVPQNYYQHFSNVENAGPLHDYPRLCLVDWKDHGHAAFYPPLWFLIGSNLDAVSVEEEKHTFEFVSTDNNTMTKDWDEQNLFQYIRNYLNDPSKYIVKTEHF